MYNEKSILILGASTMQIPAIEAAKELNLNVVLVDGNPHALAADLGDFFIPIDLKDKEGIYNYIREFTKTRHIDAVFTTGTDFSTTVAYLNERLKLPGHSYEAALNATDKARMRTLFAEHQISSPKFIEYAATTPLEEMIAAIQTWHHATDAECDVVVKPVDSMGGRGVVRVKTFSSLKEALEQACALSFRKRALIEEYIEGREFSIDSLIFDDQHIICGFADRAICYPPYFIEMGHTIPSQEDDAVYEQIIGEFKKAVKALGLTYGAAKGDMRYNGETVYIGEIAARLSGGYMSGWTFPYASKINLTKEAMRLALGETNLDLTPQQNLFCCERAFISIPGTVESIEELYPITKMAGFKNLFMRVKVGDEVDFPRNNVEKCGNILCVAEDYAHAVSRANNLKKFIFIRLKANEPRTYSFLFKDTLISSAFDADDYDFNGVARGELANLFKQITAVELSSISDKKIAKAIEKGGLQGAVWYFDSYIKVAKI